MINDDRGTTRRFKYCFFNHLVIIKNILLKYIPSGVKIKLLKSSKGV